MPLCRGELRRHAECHSNPSAHLGLLENSRIWHHPKRRAFSGRHRAGKCRLKTWCTSYIPSRSGKRAVGTPCLSVFENSSDWARQHAWKPAEQWLCQQASIPCAWEFWLRSSSKKSFTPSSLVFLKNECLLNYVCVFFFHVFECFIQVHLTWCPWNVFQPEQRFWRGTEPQGGDFSH